MALDVVNAGGLSSFKLLPFPVDPCQRVVLKQHRANAVAKESELVARKKLQHEHLKTYMRERAEGSRPKEPPQIKVSTISPNTALQQKQLIQQEEGKKQQKSRTAATEDKKRVRNVSRSPSDLLSAMVKGYLTRKLLLSNKVQLIVRTIKDAMVVLDTLATPATPQDQQLKHRMEAQLSVARLNLHEIFFKLSSAEQMSHISQSRTIRQLKKFSSNTKMITPHRPQPHCNHRHHQHQHQQQQQQQQSSPLPSSTRGTKGTHHSVTMTSKNKPSSVGGKVSAATIKSMQRRHRSNQGQA